MKWKENFIILPRHDLLWPRTQFSQLINVHQIANEGFQIRWFQSYDFFYVLNNLPLREVLISWNRKKVCKRELRLIRWFTCVHHTSRCQEPFPYCGRKSSAAVLCGTNFMSLYFPLCQILKKSDESHPTRFSVDSLSILWVFDGPWTAVRDILQLFLIDRNARTPALCINCNGLKSYFKLVDEKRTKWNFMSLCSFKHFICVCSCFKTKFVVRPVLHHKKFLRARMLQMNFFFKKNNPSWLKHELT